MRCGSGPPTTRCAACAIRGSPGRTSDWRVDGALWQWAPHAALRCGACDSRGSQERLPYQSSVEGRVLTLAGLACPQGRLPAVELTAATAECCYEKTQGSASRWVPIRRCNAVRVMMPSDMPTTAHLSTKQKKTPTSRHDMDPCCTQPKPKVNLPCVAFPCPSRCGLPRPRPCQPARAAPQQQARPAGRLGVTGCVAQPAAGGPCVLRSPLPAQLSARWALAPPCRPRMSSAADGRASAGRGRGGSPRPGAPQEGGDNGALLRVTLPSRWRLPACCAPTSAGSNLNPLQA